MILAAGYGKRLRPQTDTLPKPLFTIGMTNMLRNNIGYLLSFGIKDIAVNCFHLKSLIKKELSWGLREKVNLHIIEEMEIMGTAGGIKGAENFIGDSNFFVLNSDVLIDADLNEVKKIHESKKALATMVVRDNPSPEKIGTLAVDKQNRLVRFLDTISPHYDASELNPPIKMFTGLVLYSPEIFSHIPKGQPANISTEVYPKLVEDGRPIHTYNHTGYWVDIGTPETFADARMDVALAKYKTYSI